MALIWSSALVREPTHAQASKTTAQPFLPAWTPGDSGNKGETERERAHESAYANRPKTMSPLWVIRQYLRASSRRSGRRVRRCPRREDLHRSPPRPVRAGTGTTITGRRTPADTAGIRAGWSVWSIWPVPSARCASPTPTTRSYDQSPGGKCALYRSRLLVYMV